MIAGDDEDRRDSAGRHRAVVTPRGIRWLTVAVVGLAVTPAFRDTYLRARSDESWRAETAVVPASAMARRLADGGRVVFVDVRERAEYDDFHLPGAISLPLRDIGRGPLPAAIAGAELVVPYCLKDFRGYEAARRLKGEGVSDVVLIEGFGLNAWRHGDLPVAGRQPGRSDAEALAQLARTLELAPAGATQ